MVLDEIMRLVKEANPQRHASNIHRRTVKLIEELGEVAEAWLNVTSASNGKKKTWDDVREEVADCLIVALDIALTPLAGEDLSDLTISADDNPRFNEQIIYNICFHLALYAQSLDLASSALARREIGLVVKLAYDMTLATMPDQTEMNAVEIETQLLIEIKRKLAKWADNRSTMQVATDDV